VELLPVPPAYAAASGMTPPDVADCDCDVSATAVFPTWQGHYECTMRSGPPACGDWQWCGAPGDNGHITVLGAHPHVHRLMPQPTPDVLQGVAEVMAHLARVLAPAVQLPPTPEAPTTDTAGHGARTKRAGGVVDSVPAIAIFPARSPGAAALAGADHGIEAGGGARLPPSALSYGTVSSKLLDATLPVPPLSSAAPPGPMFVPSSVSSSTGRVADITSATVAPRGDRTSVRRDGRVTRSKGSAPSAGAEDGGNGVSASAASPPPTDPTSCATPFIPAAAVELAYVTALLHAQVSCVLRNTPHQSDRYASLSLAEALACLPLLRQAAARAKLTARLLGYDLPSAAALLESVGRIPLHAVMRMSTPGLRARMEAACKRVTPVVAVTRPARASPPGAVAARLPVAPPPGGTSGLPTAATHSRAGGAPRHADRTASCPPGHAHGAEVADMEPTSPYGTLVTTSAASASLNTLLTGLDSGTGDAAGDGGGRKIARAGPRVVGGRAAARTSTHATAAGSSSADDDLEVERVPAYVSRPPHHAAATAAVVVSAPDDSGGGGPVAETGASGVRLTITAPALSPDSHGDGARTGGSSQRAISLDRASVASRQGRTGGGSTTPSSATLSVPSSSDGESPSGSLSPEAAPRALPPPPASAIDPIGGLRISRPPTTSPLISPEPARLLPHALPPRLPDVAAVTATARLRSMPHPHVLPETGGAVMTPDQRLDDHLWACASGWVTGYQASVLYAAPRLALGASGAGAIGGSAAAGVQVVDASTAFDTCGMTGHQRALLTLGRWASGAHFGACSAGQGGGSDTGALLPIPPPPPSVPRDRCRGERPGASAGAGSVRERAAALLAAVRAPRRHPARATNPVHLRTQLHHAGVLRAGAANTVFARQLHVRRRHLHPRR